MVAAKATITAKNPPEIGAVNAIGTAAIVKPSRAELLRCKT